MGPSAGPIVLPRTHLPDYYWPQYEPATLKLIKFPADDPLIFDGREQLKVHVQPEAGGAPEDLTVPFTALSLSRTANVFPVQVRFDPTDSLDIAVTSPSGTAATMSLAFTAQTITLTDDAGHLASACANHPAPGTASTRTCRVTPLRRRHGGGAACGPSRDGPRRLPGRRHDRFGNAVA